MPRSLLLESSLPIVAAPMAGGPTTVALSTAVGKAGGFPFLAGGYKTPDALADEIGRMRATGGAFGVNVFVSASDDLSSEAYLAYAMRLQPEADRYGLQLAMSPVRDEDFWTAKLDLLLADPVPAVSFTFGLPARRDIHALRGVGSRVLASVTTPTEARAAEEAGVDGLIVQGYGAGGHSATFAPDRQIAAIPLPELVRRVIAGSSLPVVAAGGVDGPDSVRDLVQAGAEAVAVGTLFLRAQESGASQVHKDALVAPRFSETVLTKAFTGRPARALRNSFISRHEADAPLGYPELHHLTRPIRQAAARAGDPENLHLWAGTGYRAASDRPVAEIVRSLVQGL
ncbi:MAG: nitronate monooxygenase [Thermomicrobiales bacterium]